MATIINFHLDEHIARRAIIGLKGVQIQAEKHAYARAKEIYDDDKKDFIEGFLKDPISQELIAGVDGNNSAGLLEGGEGRDSLFGFIGFEAGSTPVQDVVDAINQDTHLFQKGQVKSGDKNQLEFSFRVSAPSLENLEKITPYPDKWSAGSWLRGIEIGISGLSYYMSKKILGRSRGGIEIKTKQGNPYRKSGLDKSTPRLYYTKYLNKFIDNLKKVFK